LPRQDRQANPKKAPPKRGFLTWHNNSALRLDVGRLLALGTLADFKRNLLAFFQRFETIALNGVGLNSSALPGIALR
jgi:hypothetical protein